MADNPNLATKAKRTENYYKQSEMRDNIVTAAQNKFQPPEYVVDRHSDEANIILNNDHPPIYQDEQTTSTISISQDSLSSSKRGLPTRAQQMELTMKWWNDASTDWREKWAKAKAERDRAREQVKSLRNKLETARRDFAKLQAEHDKYLLQTTTSADHSTTHAKSSPENSLTEGNSIVSPNGVQVTNKSTNDTRRNTTDTDNHLLKKELANALGTIKELQAKLASSNRNNDKAKVLEVSNLQKKITELEQERDANKKELEDYKQNHGNQISKYSRDLENAQLTALAMETKLKEAKSELSKLKADNDSDAIITKRLESEKISLLEENKVLAEKVEILQKQINEKGINLPADSKRVKAPLVKSDKVFRQPQLDDVGWVPSRTNDLNLQLGISDEKSKIHERPIRHQLPNNATKNSPASKLSRGNDQTQNVKERDDYNGRARFQEKSYDHNLSSLTSTENSFQGMQIEYDDGEDIDMITI